MSAQASKKRIGIVGGGPSALFLFQRILETDAANFAIDIFEATTNLGAGMPYSRQGANSEHVTNVSGNEIPNLVTSMRAWVQGLPRERLETFGIDGNNWSDFKVFPRLLFGEYLSAQFDLLLQRGTTRGISTEVHYGAQVTDICDREEEKDIVVTTAQGDSFQFDCVVICSGHTWPKTHEGAALQYFDSPYPPSKLELRLNHAVAIRGSSLTAIDAIRTVARSNGTFRKEGPHKLSYLPHADAPNFKLVMYSRHGMLPCVRFHLDDPHFAKKSLLSAADLSRHMEQNEGFLSLDFIFEKDFNDCLREKDPAFYETVRR